MIAPASAGEYWDITIVDNASDVCRFTSLAIGTDDCPAIGYQVFMEDDLKYAWDNGTGWQTETIESAGHVGYHTSLIMDDENHAAISYHDSSTGELKYARYDGTDWTLSVIDSAGVVGWYTSLAWDADGYPAVSYMNFSSLDLKFARNTGSGWETMTVDTLNNVGAYASLAFDATGAPTIAYHDSTTCDLKFARYDGTDWTISIVDSASDVGRYASLAYDATGAPTISYYDDSSFDLKFARFDGTDWQISTIDTEGDVGRCSSLAYDKDGNPGVSYIDTSADSLKYAYDDGGGWQITNIDPGAFLSEDTTLAFNSEGSPAIGYYDKNVKSLKYASLIYTGNLQVTSVPTGAEIRIEGINTGETTDHTFSLAAGDYNVTVSLAGYETPATQTVTVTKDGMASTEFTLVPVTEPEGNLTVTSSPTGAAIWIDGTDTGETTDHIFTSMAPGSYNVTVQLAGYEIPPTQTVTVTDGGDATAAFTLVPVTEPEGNMTVTSSPTGAEIWIDGTDTGEITDHIFTALAPGDYEVTVQLAGYETPAMQTVTVTDGGDATAAFTLVLVTEPEGNMTVTSSPTGAEIWIDGTDTGEITDHIFTKIPPGDYNVTVQLAGYETPAMQTVTVTDGGDATAAFTLVPITEPEGNLTVTSSPTGADIWIDGTNTGETTDHIFTSMAPGDYNVTVQLAGYETPPTQTVTVTDGGDATAAFTLVPITEPEGNLTVTSSPTGAEIWIEGVNTGETTDHIFTSMAPGDYNVTVQLAGYETPAIQTITVTDGGDATAAFTLIPVAVPEGNLTVTSSPTGAEIWIDGTDTGEITDHIFTALAPGDYEVTVQLAGYETPPTQTITVTDGGDATAAFTLIPVAVPEGNLTVTSSPTGAAIWIDGTDTGETTDHIFTNMAPGNYNVTVQLAGYETPAIQTVTVTDGGDATAAFTLVPVAVPEGNLTVTSVPTGAAIWIDGTDTGETTDHIFTGLAPGDYEVTVHLSGYQTPAPQTVTVTDGGNVIAAFTLTPLSGIVTVEINLSAGWNMVSIPVENATVTVPPEAGNFYRYNTDIYESVADLNGFPQGEGVWVAATGPCTLTVTGEPMDCYTKSLTSGWNMIGSCTEVMPFTGHLVSDPAGALSGQIYAYDPMSLMYVTPVSCSPGCGYWVSASTACEACLS